MSQAEKNIKSRLVLDAIVKAEGLEATDEEYEEEIKKIAGNYYMDVDRFKDMIGDSEKENIRKDVGMQKAVDFIIKEAKETKTKEKKEKKEKK